MAKKKDDKISISANDFGTLCICSVRYALGRETYMPSLLQGIMREFLSQMDERTLSVIERDIANADLWGGYGNDRIDKPAWLQCLEEIRGELIKRRKE